MSRRTKLEMIHMNNECRLYLLQTKLDYQKAFEMMVKDCLESGTRLPHYIKGIQDFKAVSCELAIELNREETMKKADKERYQIKQGVKEYIMSMSFEEVKKLYKENKDSVSNNEKLALVYLYTSKYNNDLEEKQIDTTLINVIKKITA